MNNLLSNKNTILKEKILIGQFILAVGFILLVINNMILAGNIRELSLEKRVLVQLSDGTSIIAIEKEENYRRPSIIKNFIKRWISLTFTWDGTQESGYQRRNRKKVPLNSFAASLMLSRDFASSFLDELAEIVPSGALNGDIESTVIFRYISEPILVKEGSWKVNVVADRLLFNNRTQRETLIPFNKTFHIVSQPLPIEPLKDGNNNLEKLVYSMTKNGLSITLIEDYTE